MIGRHVGRLGRHPFVLRLAPADLTATPTVAPSDARSEAVPGKVASDRPPGGTAVTDAAASHPVLSEQYWEIEYQGRFYPWRPVHPEDELDLPRLIRGAMAYLQGDLGRHG